jgi:hypothetical protein
MYLFAFVVLIVALMGVFGQVYTLQTAQFFANQKAIGQHMNDWHGAAMNFANFVIGTSLPSDPCNITTGTCGTAFDSSSTYYPPGDSSNYRWASKLFSNPSVPTSRFVITYVSVGSDNYVTSPAIGLTVNELANQLKNANVSPFSYGYVKGSPPNCNLYTVIGSSYYVPCTNGAGDLPSGSFGIVSQIK